jgi:dynein heavy chain
MLTSMREIIARSVVAYAETRRRDWVLAWPGQVVICGDSIFWTVDVSDSIQNGTLGDYLRLSNSQIDEIVGLVRGKLDGGSRTTLGALIVIAVHARDVVESLFKQKVSSVQDFAWISQLRYYLEGGFVRVRMITTDIRYGYEYLGNSPRY